MRPRLGSSSRRFATLGAALCLAACATPAPKPPPVQAPTVPEPPLRAEPEPAAPEPVAAKRRPRPRLKPMKVRPLSVQATCSFKDEVGYAASARLDVTYSEVIDFAATVDIPKHGSCRFDMTGFRQVRREPHVELLAGDGCTVRLWEQGDEVTVAFSDCASRCTRGAFDYVWPILLDRSNGRCK